MELYLLNYLNSPFKSTRYNQIGFTVPIFNNRKENNKKPKRIRAISFSEQNKAITFPKINNSFYFISNQDERENQIKQEQKVDKQEYLKRFIQPENAAKSKIVRDKDYRKYIVKLMKEKK